MGVNVHNEYFYFYKIVYLANNDSVLFEKVFLTYLYCLQVQQIQIIVCINLELLFWPLDESESKVQSLSSSDFSFRQLLKDLFYFILFFY